jgi:hypothetical protein
VYILKAAFQLIKKEIDLLKSPAKIANQEKSYARDNQSHSPRRQQI